MNDVPSIEHVRRMLHDHMPHGVAETFELTLELARHAALPAALNAELLHLIRINFVPDAPQTAEADLLLSPLCGEIGDDLFEIDARIRNVLLRDLAERHPHNERLQNIARLLSQYNRRRAPWVEQPELELAQRVTALNFLHPARVQEWMAQAEQSLGGNRTLERAWFIAMQQEIRRVEEDVRIQAINPHLPESTVVALLDTLRGQFPNTRIGVFAYDAERRTLTLDPAAEAFYQVESIRGVPLNIGDGRQSGIAGRTAQRALSSRRVEIENISDVAYDPNYLQLNPSTRSEMSVPIMRDDELLGVLVLESPVSNAFNMQDASLVLHVCSLITIRDRPFSSIPWVFEFEHDADINIGRIRNCVSLLRNDLGAGEEPTLNAIEAAAAQAAAWIKQATSLPSAVFGGVDSSADRETQYKQRIQIFTDGLTAKLLEINGAIGRIRYYARQLEQRADTNGNQPLHELTQTADEIARSALGMSYLASERESIPLDTWLHEQVEGWHKEQVRSKPSFSLVDVSYELRCPDVSLTVSPLILRHALHHVLFNAAQAVGSSGSATVRTQCVNSIAEITIEFSNSVLPKELQEQSFYDQILSNSEEGGRGLLIARMLIESLNGGIKVHTSSNAGMSIVVMVPVDQAAKPVEIDVELRITLEDERTLAFELTSPRFGYDRAPMGQTRLSVVPRQHLDLLFDDLSQVARRSVASYSAQDQNEVSARIAAFGQRLYRDLLPAELKRAYRHMRQHHAPPLTLLITSDEPWIPWELVKPFERGTPTEQLLDDPFFCEQFALTRWLAGASPSRQLEVKTIALVASASGLSYVQREQSYIDDLAQRAPLVHVLPPIGAASVVRASLREANAQLWHMACHGNFAGASPDRSAVRLDGGDLRAEEIVGPVEQGISQSQPLVVLNACHTGRQDFALTGLGGWAQQFVHAGASAFIGTQWEAHDALAAEFAVALYEALWSGQPLGQAAHAARQAIKRLDATNPTWLAYAIYGHPGLQIWLAGQTEPQQVVAPQVELPPLSLLPPDHQSVTGDSITEPAQDYQYDVFISYVEADQDWVRGWLLPRLDDAGLRVCIDVRDFSKKHHRLDEIERAITTSRYIIAVLTPNYLINPMSLIELHISQTIGIEDASRQILTLLLQPCQPLLHMAMLPYANFRQVEGWDDSFQLVKEAVQSRQPFSRAWPTLEQLIHVDEPVRYQYDVLISYSDTDYAWVMDRLLPQLKAAGLRVGTDMDFYPGVERVTSVENMIVASRYVITVLTPDYVADRWSKFELGLTQAYERITSSWHIMPILLQPCVLPPGIATRTFADLTDPPKQDAELRRMIARMQGLPIPPPLSEPDLLAYAYDVFISYSSKDAAWVRGELLPRLEQAGVKVIVDFRDFEIGVPSLINMERAVDRSRHTLIVVTPNWIASAWTEFESLLVATGDPAGRQRKLIPVMVQKCSLPPRIAMLTYLDMMDVRRIDEQMARLIRSLTRPTHRIDDLGQGAEESFSPYLHSKDFAENKLKYERNSINVTNDTADGSGPGDSVNAALGVDKLSPSIRDQIFIGYSHKDAKWLKRLQVHLKPLERSGNVTLWDDTRIRPGAKWRDEIANAIGQARVVVLLISADFLASDLIAANELPPLVAAAKAEGAVILPIIVSPSRFEQTASISRYQAVNPPAQPLADMSRARQEAVLVQAVASIEAALSQFASDAFGLSKDQWEQGHTKTGKGVIGEIYDNTYEVAFRGGYIWYIERQWTVKDAVTADDIETESTLLIPQDSQLITTYSPEGRPETVVKLYMSEGLKDRFSSESWVGGEPGNFTVQYNLWDYGVTRMIIATGNNP